MMVGEPRESSRAEQSRGAVRSLLAVQYPMEQSSNRRFFPPSEDPEETD